MVFVYEYLFICQNWSEVFVNFPTAVFSQVLFSLLILLIFENMIGIWGTVQQSFSQKVCVSGILHHRPSYNIIHHNTSYYCE